MADATTAARPGSLKAFAARIVEARVFAGLSVEETAAAFGLSRAAAYREWSFARAWLATALAGNPKKS